MTDSYLLDTCAAIWIADNAEMSEHAVAVIEAADSGEATLWVSPITAWEVGMLVAKERLNLGLDPKDWLRQLCEQPGIELTEVDGELMIDASFLPGGLHGDPADRMIIATARATGMTILTRDRRILDYAQQGHVLALEC